MKKETLRTVQVPYDSLSCDVCKKEFAWVPKKVFLSSINPLVSEEQINFIELEIRSSKFNQSLHLHETCVKEIEDFFLQLTK